MFQKLSKRGFMLQKSSGYGLEMCWTFIMQIAQHKNTAYDKQRQ